MSYRIIPLRKISQPEFFRHERGKWFALAMNIGERKLGHVGDKKIDVVNFKCDTEVIESLAGIEPGIYLAQLQADGKKKFK